MIAAAKKHGRILQVGSQGISSKTQETAREWIRAGRLGKVTLVRAAYNRNTKSGAWLYPIPPDANEKTVDFSAFLGPAPKRPFSLERFFRWRCYWDYSGGLATDLFVHLLTTIHFLLDADMPSRVVAAGQNYRFRETHEVPDTLNAILEYPRGLHRRPRLHLQQRGGRGLRDPGERRLARVPRREGRAAARAPGRGQRLDRGVVAGGAGARVLRRSEGDRRGAARPRGRPAWRRAARPSKRWGRTPTKVHLARFFESVRTRKAPVEDGERGHRAAAAAHLVNESVRGAGRSSGTRPRGRSEKPDGADPAPHLP